jgi:hypothetical protein
VKHVSIPIIRDIALCSLDLDLEKVLDDERLEEIKQACYDLVPYDIPAENLRIHFTSSWASQYNFGRWFALRNRRTPFDITDPVASVS